MSNALAIATVTDTLRSLIAASFKDLGFDANVTVQPPDKAHDDTFQHFVNLFLYQVLPNAAWRNIDTQSLMKPGSTSMPPLALNLYYMLTAYSQGDDLDPPNVSTRSHQLLGRAMSTLHDHAILLPGDIALAHPPSELQSQIERVRVTLQPLSVEEIFRLWSGFQSQYRISVAYEVAVILINSTQPTKTPLPVLTRGQGDSGVNSQANLIASFPTLENIVFPQLPSALLGDTLTFEGHDLLPGPDSAKLTRDSIDNSKTTLSFMNPRWLTPVEIAPTVGRPYTASAITVTLPNDPEHWPTGFYTVSAVFKTSSGKIVRTSNEISFSLAPAILATPAMKAIRSDGDVIVTLRCSPSVQQTVEEIIQGTTQTIIKAQTVALLLGDQQALFVFPEDNLLPQSDLSFTFPSANVSPGDYYVRLRVDGVDSLLVDRSTTPPTFRQSQKVTVP